MKKVLNFIEHTQLPVYVTRMAKGGIDENHPQFRGVFAGNSSLKQMQKEVYSADLVLSIGSVNSDFNAGDFTYGLSQEKTIGLHTYHTKIFYTICDKVDMHKLLPDLTEKWPTELIRQRHVNLFEIPSPVLDQNKNEIIHEYFWYKLSDFIPENSIIIVETGKSEFGEFH